jgi:drug/metabolite transporter (DMT)-like permease
MSAYLAAFMSSLLWGIATQLYSNFVKKLKVYRFVLYKSIIAFVLFSVSSFLMKESFFPKLETLPWLFISGFIGFGIADLLIFYSYSSIGPYRTLMIKSFTPTFVAIFSYFILGKVLPLEKAIGILLIILCLIFLAYDQKKANKHFSWNLILYALIGVFFDSLGVVFSKKAFMIDENLTSMNANVFRIIPAIIFLFILLKFKKLNFNFFKLNRKTKSLVILSSTLGTFLALFFYLYAISKKGFHPSTIVALTSLAPILASIYEHIVEKRRPNRYFFLATFTMVIGVIIIVI